MSKFSVFLFDADRTLFDFDLSEEIALQETFKKFGLDYNNEILIRYREINDELWLLLQNRLTSVGELQVRRFDMLSEDYSLGLDSVEVNDYYLSKLAQGNQLIEGAESLCRELYHLDKRLYIVTNGSAHTQTSRFEASAIKPYFKDVFISQSIGESKPNIGFFEHVFENIQGQKEEMLIIGDSLSADIKGGQNAQIKTCWVNLNQQENRSGIVPDFEINHLSELIDYI